MIVRIGFALLVAALAFLTLRSIPDVVRYLKIREM
jgi:hypothetical protein